MEKDCNTLDAFDTQLPTTIKPLINRFGDPSSKGLLKVESYNENPLLK